MTHTQLIARIVAPLVVVAAILGIAKVVAFAIALPTQEASRRTDDTYIERIAAAYPAMRDTFTVTDVKITKQHWVVVGIKNKQNSDTLSALLYDPTGSVGDMRVVSAPTTRSNYDDLMTPANILVTNGDS